MTAGPSSESGARSEPPKPGEHARALTEILAERIRRGGSISFAEFMRECLYHPAHGYYSRDNSFYVAWDTISKDRESFAGWMKQHVMEQGPEVFVERAGLRK